MVRKVPGVGTALLAAILFTSAASAQTDVADFYRSHTIDLYVAGAQGGAFDLHTRMVAPFLKRHIPGNPTILVRPMPGAGGARLANYMFAVAPKQGTAIATLLPYIATAQAVNSREVQYDARRFGYLGSIAPINSVLATWNATTPVKSFAEMKSREVVLGSTGRSSITFIAPTLANQQLGTKFKIVTGYPATAPIMIAMARGEVHGRVADYEGISGPHADWLANKLVTLHFHTGLEPDPSMPGVPRLMDLAHTKEQRAILEFLAFGSAIGRVFVTTPDVPKDRLEALRKGFAAAVADPEYLQMMAERRLLVAPKSGANLESIVEQTLAAPSSVTSEAAKLFNAD